MGGKKEKRIVDNCMKLWIWRVFTKLGKSRGSICTANFSCFNITGDTATVSSYFGCLEDDFFFFFLGHGFSYREGEGRRFTVLVELVAHRLQPGIQPWACLGEKVSYWYENQNRAKLTSWWDSVLNVLSGFRGFSGVVILKTTKNPKFLLDGEIMSLSRVAIT